GEKARPADRRVEQPAQGDETEEARGVRAVRFVAAGGELSFAPANNKGPTARRAGGLTPPRSPAFAGDRAERERHSFLARPRFPERVNPLTRKLWPSLPRVLSVPQKKEPPPRSPLRVEQLEDRTLATSTPATPDPFLFTRIPEDAPLALHIHPNLKVFI